MISISFDLFGFLEVVFTSLSLSSIMMAFNSMSCRISQLSGSNARRSTINQSPTVGAAEFTGSIEMSGHNVSVGSRPVSVTVDKG